ncbi:MAG: hypothetical protein HDR00_05840 [Lachnospiraceae bacterium]|nr:hypothetical protein [Lachnospiraceae bacterium]
MNKRIGWIAALCLTGALLCGCQKEETVNVVTEQPVLGVDEAGYAGFEYLSAYTLEGEGEESVLYLPTDGSAYVGGTCIISKTEGVEVTLNYNPLFSDDIAKKPVKQKLQYILDSEYSDIYAEKYAMLDISDIKTFDNNGVGAEVSYVIYDDANKDFTANWLEYYYIQLEDGREFKAVIKVDSDQESGQTAAVIEELEKYFEIELSYESGFLQAKLDGYEPGSDELVKMNTTTVPYAGFNFYFPEGWEESIANALITDEMLANEGIADMVAYTREKNDLGFEEAIMLAKAEFDMNSGQFGRMDKGDEKRYERMLNETAQKEYHDNSAEVKVLGKNDLGYVIRMDIKKWNGISIYAYYIFRGDNTYMLAGMIVQDADDSAKEALYEEIDQIYSTAELQ